MLRTCTRRRWSSRRSTATSRDWVGLRLRGRATGPSGSKRFSSMPPGPEKKRGLLDDRAAVRRVTQLRGVLLAATESNPIAIRRCSSTSSYNKGTQDKGEGGDEWLSVGGVKVKIGTPLCPYLVPQLYAKDPLSQTTLRHLQWMLRKDSLGQDMFLLGPPGPLRRHLALSFCELVRREMEYVSLSRDTTEMDLKQRREIQSGTVHYMDQAAVRAAIKGRVLVLEGIEKAERNVLPVLNNLLENREMQLDDGRFMLGPSRYDKLMEEHGGEMMDQWKLVRADERFRVIALGLPVPPYQGNPLDPPLRSRFQARNVFPIPFQEQLEQLLEEFGNAPKKDLSAVLSVLSTLHSLTQTSPTGPIELSQQARMVAMVMHHTPGVSPASLLQSVYPSEALGTSDVLKEAMQRFGLSLAKDPTFSVKDCTPLPPPPPPPPPPPSASRSPTPHGSFSVSLSSTSSHPHTSITSSATTLTFPVEGWPEHRQGEGTYAATPPCSHYNSQDPFVAVAMHDDLLGRMLLSHLAGDFCLVGGRGTGKTRLVNQFASMLGYSVEPIVLYQDMTSRELLQQRTTREGGDTGWRLSPLVSAALEGRLAVLDGVHRLDISTLSVLKRLVQDRELLLLDGTRLMGEERFLSAMASAGLTHQEMAERQVYPIHPKFRMIGIGEPQGRGSGRGSAGKGAGPSSSSTATWVTPELLSIFGQFHMVRPLPLAEEKRVISSKVPTISEEKLGLLLRLAYKLRTSTDATLLSLSSSLSTRQLLRISRQLEASPDECLHQALTKACLARFLPQLARAALSKSLAEVGIHPPSSPSPSPSPSLSSLSSFPVSLPDRKIEYTHSGSRLRIGNAEAPVKGGHSAVAMVPDVLFYDNQQHLRVMEEMLKDFVLGEHLLLVGNQGVGKNKIADRFLQLLNLPREYLQLHRDTTVQTLTLQPSVQDGVISYKDSPLVRALETGRVLVIDEADKAPTHVTCILKNLLEGGEVLLADGRRIIPASRAHEYPRHKVVLMHSDFRMVVLANRPGFPFLGNDFFAALGDIFSCHAVDNPDMDSEMAMLRQYGPSVPEATLRKLVLAFGELREMADEGLIAYPYSTREVVSVVKHLQLYPEEGVGGVVRNVFDFDSFHPELLEVVVKVMHQHSIPIGASPTNVQLAPEHPLPPPKLVGRWMVGVGSTSGVKVQTTPLSLKGPYKLPSDTYPIDRRELRGRGFSELKSVWSIPMHETSQIEDICAGCSRNGNETLHIAVSNPPSLYSMPLDSTSLSLLDLSSPQLPLPSFPLWGRGGARLSLAPLVWGKGEERSDHCHGWVLLHEARSNHLMMLQPSMREAYRIVSNPFTKVVKDLFSLSQRKPADSTQPFFKMVCGSDGNCNTVGLYQEGNPSFSLLDFTHRPSPSSSLAPSPLAHYITLPFPISTLHPITPHQWMVQEAPQSKLYLLDTWALSQADTRFNDRSKEGVVTLHKLNITGQQAEAELGVARGVSCKGMPAPLLLRSIGGGVGGGGGRESEEGGVGEEGGESSNVDQSDALLLWNRVLVGGQSLGMVMTGEPMKEGATGSLYSFPSDANAVPSSSRPTIVPSEGEVVYPMTFDPTGELGIAVVDLPRHTHRSICLPTAEQGKGSLHSSPPSLHLASLHDGSLVAVDHCGGVRVMETGHTLLGRSLSEWQSLVGGEGEGEGEGHLQVTRERDGAGEVTTPKHGKVDPSNAPHIGGNTWAGGTGGRDTAGLGGKGGPYRLDAGHDVFQLSDQEKQAVPEEVQRAAREMGQKAFKEKLREIEMSEHDAELYQKMLGKVQRQVQTLRVMLDSIQAKSSERQWIRHQTSGDLDERKLIEGLTGEKAIYKRRGEKSPEFGSDQLYPKRIRLVADVSASMYRFNGHDGRLDRSLQAVLMVMEAFDKHHNKFQVDIYGHSGDEIEIPFVSSSSPPSNDKERLNILKGMIAHSQYSWAGDHTVEATRLAIEEVTKEPGDEYFVVVVSDANFSRYGIRPRDFAALMMCDPRVNVFAIFIGSLGNQATRLKDALPAGRSFICRDTKDLPQILQQIFSTTLV